MLYSEVLNSHLGSLQLLSRSVVSKARSRQGQGGKYLDARSTTSVFCSANLLGTSWKLFVVIIIIIVIIMITIRITNR